MRELKIFIIILIFTGVVYWGVEPYAHSQMHEHTSAVNFDFKSGDLELANKQLDAAKAKLEAAQKQLEAAASDEEKKAANDELASKQADFDFYKAQLEDTEAMYAQVEKISALKGDAEQGEEAFNNTCAGCHSGEADAKMGGIVPPELSTAGAIYDHNFLAAIMLNPALAMKNNKKFNEDNAHPMAVSFTDDEGEELSEDARAQVIANIIAYLASQGDKAIASKQEELAAAINEEKISDAEKAAKIAKAKQFVYFNEACGRCHDVKYDNHFANTDGAELVEYMGSTPPDLSIIIRAKGEEYLAKFINDTQKQLPGTAMPRVGLNEAAQAEAISYLQKVGDSKLEERQQHGYYIMGFFALLALLAFGWKSAVWRDLH